MLYFLWNNKLKISIWTLKLYFKRISLTPVIPSHIYSFSLRQVTRITVSVQTTKGETQSSEKNKVHDMLHSLVWLTVLFITSWLSCHIFYNTFFFSDFSPNPCFHSSLLAVICELWLWGIFSSIVWECTPEQRLQQCVSEVWMCLVVLTWWAEFL